MTFVVVVWIANYVAVEHFAYHGKIFFNLLKFKNNFKK